MKITLFWQTSPNKNTLNDGKHPTDSLYQYNTLPEA